MSILKVYDERGEYTRSVWTREVSILEVYGPESWSILEVYEERG